MQPKPPQVSDIDPLNQINQAIAGLVGGLGKSQMTTSPAQALQSITGISKVIDNQLSEALNFDGTNGGFKTGGNVGTLMQAGHQQKKSMAEMAFAPTDLDGLISDTKGAYPGLLDDLQSQIIGQIMRSSRVNYPTERTGQSSGTPFFAPQDQRGQVPNAAANFQFGQLQGWNLATNHQDI